MSACHICSLYSGSAGNAVLIRVGVKSILIDAGKSARSLCRALTLPGSDIKNIDAIFITHEHADHIGALEVLLKKHKIPVHIVAISAQKMLMRARDIHEDVLCLHPPMFTVKIGNMTISSFPTPHDSEYSVGYRIEIGENDSKICVGYATDIGYISNEIKDALCGCESVVLECNHDEEMLMNGPYPYDLKLRIKSKRGHLSNRECAEFASDLCFIGTKNILLAHLSEENNDPELAFDEVWTAIADESVNLKVANQYEPVNLI